MHRNIVAFLLATLASGVVVLGTYQAFFVLMPIVSQGTSLGLVVLGLGVLCVIGCATVGCTAHRFLSGVQPAVWQDNNDLNTTRLLALMECNSDLVTSKRKPLRAQIQWKRLS